MPVLKPLSGSGEAPQQHKQPSRKGKKAWRKNVDVSEVQDGLDALNEEIIRGGVVAEKDSKDLFVVDTVGETSAPKKERKSKTLKADEIIAQRSAVPAVSLRKRPAPKTSDGILPVKRQRKDWVSHAEVARLRRVADGQGDESIIPQEATYDLWGAPAPQPKTVVAAPDSNDDFLTPPQEPKAPGTLRQKPVTLAKDGKSVPSVSKPAGAYSYNPLFEDYANRLKDESEKAVEAEKKRIALEEAARLKAEAVAKSAAEAEAAESKAELSEWDEDSAWEGFDTDAEENSGATRKQPKRKTTVQRNRYKRRKELEGLMKHTASLKEREKQAARIKELTKEIEEREALRKAMVPVSDSESEGELDASAVELRRKKLGKMKLPQSDLELVLPEDLRDSLRQLKPEGNLLKDRYRNMLVQGKVEARRRIPFKKNPRVRFSEKWAYKDFKI